MDLLRPRLLFLFVFLFCAAMIGIALYMQEVMLLQPCHLCITQRICFILTGAVALAGFIHNPGPRGRMAYGLGSAFFALAGAGFALRQIHLQGLPPDRVPICGPSLGYMFEEFPLSEALMAMFAGDGNCAQISWQDPIIGFSIPQWSLVGFILLAAVSAFQAFRR